MTCLEQPYVFERMRAWEEVRKGADTTTASYVGDTDTDIDRTIAKKFQANLVEFILRDVVVVYEGEKTHTKISSISHLEASMDGGGRRFAIIRRRGFSPEINKIWGMESVIEATRIENRAARSKDIRNIWDAEPVTLFKKGDRGKTDGPDVSQPDESDDDEATQTTFP